jgi:hypothetical protein
MWIIKMKLSRKDKTYTTYEESTTTEEWANLRYESILQDWYYRLCTEVRYRFDSKDNDMLEKLIRYNLDLKNDGSVFEISKEKLI